MNEVKINVINEVGSKYCVDSDDGQRIYNLIIDAFRKNRKVVLSFLNVEILTTAFLNTAIGQLYKDFSEDFIKNHLSVEDINKNGLISIKRVVETAKEYYKNPNSIEQSLKDILDE